MSSKEKGLFALISFSFAAALFSVLKFWPTIIVVAFVILGLVLIYFRIKADKNISLPSMVFPTIILLLVITFSAMSKSTRYYFVSIKYNMHSERDYWTWDKYAWFLNINGKQQDSLDALKKAEAIALKNRNTDALDMIHNQMARLDQANWKRFK